ncbi:MAG: hypothetical protein HN348_15190 [Proteobacteria bacterium]|nr:hypothetical protein [Pseudomonadota bacterium]
MIHLLLMTAALAEPVVALSETQVAVIHDGLLDVRNLTDGESTFVANAGGYDFSGLTRFADLWIGLAKEAIVVWRNEEILVIHANHRDQLKGLKVVGEELSVWSSSRLYFFEPMTGVKRSNRAFQHLRNPTDFHPDGALIDFFGVWNSKGDLVHVGDEAEDCRLLPSGTRVACAHECRINLWNLGNGSLDSTVDGCPFPGANDEGVLAFDALGQVAAVVQGQELIGVEEGDKESFRVELAVSTTTTDLSGNWVVLEGEAFSRMAELSTGRPGPYLPESKRLRRPSVPEDVGILDNGALVRQESRHQTMVWQGEQLLWQARLADAFILDNLIFAQIDNAVIALDSTGEMVWATPFHTRLAGVRDY